MDAIFKNYDHQKMFGGTSAWGLEQGIDAVVKKLSFDTIANEWTRPQMKLAAHKLSQLLEKEVLRRVSKKLSSKDEQGRTLRFRLRHAVAAVKVLRSLSK